MGEINRDQRVRALRAKKKRKRRAVFLFLEIIVLAILSVVAYGMHKLGKLNTVEIDPAVINTDIDLEDFTNIALFGTDERDSEPESIRSDTMIVASLDNKNKKIRLVSVYRDTFLKQGDGTYDKANSAYALGGPEAAVEQINRNLDLNVSKYASVNFGILSQVIDGLGGIDIELTSDEVTAINELSGEAYYYSGKEYQELMVQDGVQTLDGSQSVAFARIRSLEGGDFKRTERQRIIIEKIIEKAKNTNLFTLNKLVDEVLPQVTTNFSAKEILEMATQLLKYDMGDMAGFPFEAETPDVEAIPGYYGSYVVPANLEWNVSELHKLLFPREEYIPSNEVVSISNDILYLTGIDRQPETDINTEQDAGGEAESQGYE